MPVFNRALPALTALLLVAATSRALAPGAADCPRGTIITVAGTGVFPYFGEGGPATEANIKPSAVVLGAKGIYVADAASHRVFLIDPEGLIHTIAGNGKPAFARDGGPATEASLNEPRGLAIGPDGSLYIADSGNHRVRKVDPNGIITKIAGNGADAYAGDGGRAVRASLNSPNAVAVAGDGSVYIADTLNSRIRKVDPKGIITTVAGTGEFAAGTPQPEDLFAAYERVGDGGPATKARLHGPTDVAIGVDGSLYIADMVNGRVRKVDTQGIITTVAGKGLAAVMREFEEWIERQQPAPTGDGGPATEARVAAFGIDVGTDGSLYLVDWASVRKVDPNGIITTVAGGSGRFAFSGDGGPAIEAAFSSVRDVAVGADGSLYIVDEGNYRLRKVDPDGVISTIAGTGHGEWYGDGAPALEASLSSPTGLAVAADGSVYVADWGNNRIRKVAPDGFITTVAGRGPSGVPPSDDWAPAGPGPATEAALLHPQDVELGSDGSLYIVDLSQVRKVDRTGMMTTVAGDPSADPTSKDIGDGGPATEAALAFAYDVTLGAFGRLYIADTGHHRIRRVNLDGTIVTFAGNGDREHSGDGGPATEAGIPGPTALAFGSDGSLYIADRSSHAVRKVDSDGIITTIAGSGIAGHEGWGYSGDGGPASRARLQSPAGLTIGPDGCLYIADSGNHRIRKIDRKGIITTVAGSGPGGNEGGGFSGDGGPATKARLRSPHGIAFDREGNLYIADSGNDRIRKVCGVAK